MHLGLENIKDILSHLESMLANTYVIAIKTQNFHWNVRDARFHMLHDLFSQQYNQLAEAIDDIAERIRVLDGYAPASMKAYLKLANLKEITSVIYDGNTMLQELKADHLSMIRILRAAIEKISMTKDQGTLDFMIQRLQYHEKVAWILSSHF